MTIAALLLLLQVRVVVLDPTLPREWVNSIVWEAEQLHGQKFLPTRYRRDPLNGAFMAWDARATRLFQLRSSKLHRQMKRRGKIVHYLQGKTSDGFYGGSAFQSGDISMGFVNPIFVNGTDASAHAVTIVTHEIGHSRCAYHVDTLTIMNTYALGFRPQPREWDPRNIFEMRRCRK